MEIINMNDKVDYLTKQEALLLQHPSQNTSSSPPSASSSPTHEFSFTVAIRPNPPPTSTQPPAAIDLSPADDIFLHGHLLPLHVLSHLPVSPSRSSTNSMDSFTLPMNLLYDQTNPIGNNSFHCHHQTTFFDFDEPEVTTTDQEGPKSKAFSIFGMPKSKKSEDVRKGDEDQYIERNDKKKLKSDLGQLIKRYMKMMKPLLSFPRSRRGNRKFNHQSYSFSGNSLDRKPPKMNGMRRGQFSAPVSMRTSPGNSRILASGTASPTKSVTSESTMDELHAAIQAAIAHCKNSSATEDKIPSQN